MYIRRFMIIASMLAAFGCGGDDKCEGDACSSVPGKVGAACLQNQACDPGGRCMRDVCEACELGTEGCACLANRGCSSNLSCTMGVCAGTEGFVQPIPGDAKCFTPCKSGYSRPDGTFAPCNDEGLLEGCVAPNECVSGTCFDPSTTPQALTRASGLEPGEDCTADADCGMSMRGDQQLCVGGKCQALCGVSDGQCSTDGACPDFQVCVLGRCYSNCNADADCPLPGRCFRHACRLACTTNGPACPQGRSCVSSDGTNGFCMPNVVPAVTQNTNPPNGTFALKTSGTEGLVFSSFKFSNVTTETTFFIVNTSPAHQTFKVTKVSHTEYGADDDLTMVKQDALNWLELGKGTETPAPVQSLEVGIDGTDSGLQNFVAVTIAGAANPNFDRWDGLLEVSNPTLGRTQVNISYRATPAGRWSGKMYYFSSFGSDGLDAWSNLRPRSEQLLAANYTSVKNAFVQQWIGFKSGNNFPVDRFDAMTQSTQLESYDWALLKQYCPEPNRVCYPFDNTQGYFEYTSDVTQFPVPKGMTELPFAMDIAPDPAVLMGRSELPAGATGWSGRIATEKALHYAGDPKVELVFSTEPTACPTNTGGATLCQLEDFVATISVGGNYFPDTSDTDCSKAPGGTGSYERVATPWLVPGFLAGTVIGENNVRKRYECRDKLLPFGPTAVDQNKRFAASNPIPDGRTRKRTLTMVDGFLVNQRTLVIIFKEGFDSFFGAGDTDIAGYGFMTLERSSATLDSQAFSGNTQSDTRVQTNDLLNVSCNDALIDGALGSDLNANTPMPTTAAPLRRIAEYTLGVPDRTTPPTLLPYQEEYAHYLCVDTGQFDGGYASATNAQRVECPPQSRVEYFTLTNYTASLAAHSCNGAYRENVHTAGGVSTHEILTKGTCGETLALGQFGAGVTLRRRPIFACTNNTAYCETDRLDLLHDKVFYALPSAGQTNVLVPLDTDVDLAFQYKTRFRSRTGRSVGFAPQICAAGVEYCYDPSSIEAVRERVNCVASIYTKSYNVLAAQAATETMLPPDQRIFTNTLAAMRAALVQAFSYLETTDAENRTTTKEGFEWLNSELLIMLGDDAYTAAFASRFDLAEQSVRSFPGRDFEGPDGINLSGAAGFELYTLYQATQEYQLALERFYRLAPLIQASLSLPNGFITNASVSSYFARVIRASTQKARAFSEIARRYQDFNQPALARRVVLRAYTAAYLESIATSNLLAKLRARAAIQNTAEITRNLSDSARRYRSALLDMSDLYDEIVDDVTYFGFAPNYVPFPPIGFQETGEINAFEKLLASAKDKASVAAEKENAALGSRRDFDTDGAAFENELVRIRIDYENQLSDLCGTIQTPDGRLYPATSDYAFLNERARTLRDPCGLMGTGAIHEALVGVDLANLELEEVLQQQSNTLAEIAIETKRVDEQCGAIAYTVTRIEGDHDTQIALSRGIKSAEVIGGMAERVKANTRQIASIAKCSGLDCIGTLISAAIFTGVAIVAELVITPASIAIAAHQVDKEILENGIGRWETMRECDYAKIDSAAKIKLLWLELNALDLEILEKLEQTRLAASVVVKSKNQSVRLIQEQKDAEELLINVEAARNDPNARIFKNDAILSADRTFRSAVREAYRATKAFEYYTSQSYAHLDDLFLVRLVQFGDRPLEAYLASLEEDFAGFEDQFGNPDVRVEVISLRDDILKIPKLNSATNTALCESDRVMLFRHAVLNPSYLDDRGYRTFSFSTNLNRLSPLTANHKVYYVEAEYVGSDLGDPVGRVYLTSKGTGTIRTLDDDKRFYALPKRTAVVNTFFNGERFFYDNTRVTDVYVNFTLRDLPVVNSSWELILNTKDEDANLDVNLSSLSDVRLYVYYSDFTELSGR